MHLRAHDFDVLTFDCYGTLIDWETGILTALRPILSTRGKSLSDAEILELYSEFEADAEAGPYQSYREVLATVVRRFGAQLSFEATSREEQSLSNGLPQWRPWPDTVKALARLKSRFRLAIISNIDDDLFVKTCLLLQIEFSHVTTAQQARCYKPSLGIFQHAVAAAGVPAKRILHVGQSLYHDVRPAHALGIAAVWVNRPSARRNLGAVRRAEAVPDLEVANLKRLADILLPDEQGH